MSGFPKLIPAFTSLIPVTAPSDIGSVKSGGLHHVAFVENSGSLKSEPGYPLQVDAVFLHGSDYLRADPGLEHMRLEVTSLAKDKTGALIRYCYTGTLPLGGPAGKVLTNAPDAKSTDFGEVYTQVSFETGTAELKALEHKVFVGSGRFILEEGKPLTVEYKISEVSQ